MTFLRHVLALALVVVLADAQQPSSPPNVLLIIADDLGWNGVSYHNPKMVTPALAQLAKEGVQLERFYGYPVCSPARSALLTGMMPRRFGLTDVVGPGQQGIPKGTPTLASTLQSAGYRTSLIGKWHLGTNPGPLGYGFDHFYGFLGPEIDYFTHLNQRGVIDWARDGKTVEEKGYSTTLIADEAIAQLKQRDRLKPFYMQVAFNAPHTPLAAPAELIAKYKSDALYTAVIEGLDIGIGRILASLDEQGLRANTVVIFCSDNGATRRFSPNTPLSFGKGTVQEGGIRVPAIVRWPGKVAAGVLSQQPVAAHDLFPSLLAALSLPIPEKIKFDGSNQWPALSTGKTLPRPAFLIAAQDIAFFDGDWKIIESSDGKRSLYNLRTDLGESKDLLASQPELAAKLGAKLDALKQGLPAVIAGGAGKGAGKGAKGKGKK